MTTRFIGFDPVTLNIVDSFYGSGSAGRSKKMKYMQVDPDVHIRNVKVVKVSELEYALENKVPTEQYLENQKTLENAFIYENLRNERNRLLSQTDKYATIDFPHGSEAAKQAWLDYRQALRDLPSTTDAADPTWPIAPDAEFPELKTRVQALETHANSAIQILSDFGVSGLMDPITTTWPAKATSAVLDARLKPIETGATDARAILDLFGVENLPIFTVDETSTFETRISVLETAGAAAQQKLQAFGIDI